MISSSIPALTGFTVHEVRELAWVLLGPGLLTGTERTVGDAHLRSLYANHNEHFAQLESSPLELLKFLELRPNLGRLGRHFESLLEFLLLHVEEVETLERNIQVKSDRKQTLGELDLIFRTTRVHHWEASVKFYLSCAQTPDEARSENFYMGTLVFDRLDRKIQKLMEKQLALPRVETCRRLLDRQGLADPESRALLKGYIYYPADRGWATHAHPASLAPEHVHGWWTSPASLFLPQTEKDSHYVLLPPARWLAPFAEHFRTFIRARSSKKKSRALFRKIPI